MMPTRFMIQPSRLFSCGTPQQPEATARPDAAGPGRVRPQYTTKTNRRHRSEARQNEAATGHGGQPPHADRSFRANIYIDNLGNGALRLRGLGATGKTYQIEATSQLDAPVWTTLGSATADGNGRFTFFTSQAADGPARFYRAVYTPPATTP